MKKTRVKRNRGRYIVNTLKRVKWLNVFILSGFIYSIYKIAYILYMIIFKHNAINILGALTLICACSLFWVGLYYIATESEQ